MGKHEVQIQKDKEYLIKNQNLVTRSVSVKKHNHPIQEDQKERTLIDKKI